MVADTLTSKESTIRIHDDFCKEDVNRMTTLSSIVSESYRRRQSSVTAPQIEGRNIQG